LPNSVKKNFLNWLFGIECREQSSTFFYHQPLFLSLVLSYRSLKKTQGYFNNHPPSIGMIVPCM
ncbi:hypothetical protein CUN43_12075, partial [Enterococcus faecium]